MKMGYRCKVENIFQAFDFFFSTKYNEYNINIIARINIILKLWNTQETNKILKGFTR